MKNMSLYKQQLLVL